MQILLGIIIGTAIFQAIKMILVGPMAQYLTKKKLVEPEKVLYLPEKTGLPVNMPNMKLLNKCYIERQVKLYNKYYLIADVSILGLVGFLMGLLFGWFFVGIAFRWRGIPSMIAFISASYGGYLLHG